MKIVFIRPHLTDTRSSDAMEPLAFAILAARTPPDVELAFYDERLAPIPDPCADQVSGADYVSGAGQTSGADSIGGADLAALSVETYTARRAYQISTSCSRAGIPVVLGGYHPSFVPQEALAYADAVVVGDAEGVWEQVVKDARRGTLQRIYKQSEPSSLEGLVFDRSIFAGKRYNLLAPVQFGRGCRNACDFCSIHAFYGTSLRQRPVREVAAEVEALNRPVFFVDDNLYVPNLEELVRALVPLNVRWVCQASVDIAQNTDLLDLMARSGCLAVTVGLESLNRDNLRQMRKNQDLDGYARAIQRFQERGIMVYGTFVFGYDGDNVDSFDATIEFAIRSKFCLANFNPLTPTPGARLYDRLRAEGRLIYDRWWLAPDYRYGQATFHPKGMTAEQLTEGCLNARRQFNRYSSILSRAFGSRANCHSLYHLGAFMASNLISRREIFRKQGHRLGSDEPLAPLQEGS
jgi:radical SAM superfamily enzyme YgiQ (UPF0313 family)